MISTTDGGGSAPRRGRRATLLAKSCRLAAAALFPVLAGCMQSGASAAPQRTDAAAPARPNIVLVITDQWRAQALGYNGNTQVATPNIDKLSKEGANFTLAVANTPVCSPTRAALMTGRYSTQNGVFYNDRPLRQNAVTIAETLKANGYQTALIGKWHLDGFPKGRFDYAAREHPVPAARRQGFEFWKAGEAPHEYWHSVYFDENNQRHVWPGYDAIAQTAMAKRYIADHKARPFFLMVSFGPPHNPYNTAPPADQALYAGRKITLRPNVPAEDAGKARKDLRGYYAHIAALDRLVGELERTVEDEGIARNTIFVFTSDHGDMLFSHGQTLKQKPWDESIRVPFLLKYPGHVRPHTVTTPFSSPDIMPTLLGLSGVPIPSTVSGLNFTPEVLGTGRVSTSGALLLLPTPFGSWNFAHGGRAFRGIRTERYTYAIDLHGPWLLYDDKADPYQLRNLVDDPAYAPQRAALAKALAAQLARIGDTFRPPQCYMDQWGLQWNPEDKPTSPEDAICPPERKGGPASG